MGVGKVPEEAEGGRKPSYRVTMTTMRAAPSRWEPQWKEAQILTKAASREEGGLGAKKQL